MRAGRSIFREVFGDGFFEKSAESSRLHILIVSFVAIFITKTRVRSALKANQTFHRGEVELRESSDRFSLGHNNSGSATANVARSQSQGQNASRRTVCIFYKRSSISSFRRVRKGTAHFSERYVAFSLEFS